MKHLSFLSITLALILSYVLLSIYVPMYYLVFMIVYLYLFWMNVNTFYIKKESMPLKVINSILILTLFDPYVYITQLFICHQGIGIFLAILSTLIIALDIGYILYCLIKKIKLNQLFYSGCLIMSLIILSGAFSYFIYLMNLSGD
ncbi:MAG: hypothetical protein K2M08_06875 [Anaeroplasmataceae bacterium]|nr:hypothetical protein [Anaeroplasmataceae bacterium]